MNPPLPPKKDVVLVLLERSNVDIHLDPRRAGVVVPPQFHREPRLILKIGLNMPVPIPDLHIDDDGMACTLSFNRVRFYCVLPWSSVFAMVGEDGRGMVWPEDVPSELVMRPEGAGAGAESKASASEPNGATSSARSSKTKPRLRDASAPLELVSGEAPEGRSRRTKKSKKDHASAAKPALLAVPAAPASTPAEPEAPAAPVSTPEIGSPRDASAETPAGEPPPTPAAPTPRVDVGASRVPSRGAPKPKRELPPYLRVVK
jgi:stringent starvation protein B